MAAENASAARGGWGQVYGEDAFLKLIDKEGLGHNNVMNLLRLGE